MTRRPTPCRHRSSTCAPPMLERIAGDAASPEPLSGSKGLPSSVFPPKMISPRGSLSVLGEVHDERQQLVFHCRYSLLPHHLNPQKDDLTGEFSAIHPEKLLHSLSPSFLQSFMSLSLHSFSTSGHHCHSCSP